MNPMNSILAATDFSAPARHAADRAARLAHETGAQLTLMHTVSGRALDELRQWLGAGHAAEAQLLEDAGQQLRKLAEELASTRRVKTQTHLATGPVVTEIEREADAVQASLVVLGARGAGFLRRLVLGTTSERLLKHTHRPVLVVKQTPHEPYRRVLVALDFSPWSVHAIALARRVAPNARLVLLHAFEVPFEGKLRVAGVDTATIEHYRRQAGALATQQLHHIAQQAGLAPGHWDARVIEGDPWQRIVEQEQECDCDLVVLGKHGRSAAEELFLGSVTRSVLTEGSGDVLVSMAGTA
ncbi:MAG: universal stress protein [Polaromonas sp.]|uniref:universal stress protein n=1 Tax=Polaromonas sp. TaxID=1869339 RepID=UPI00272F9612|nr:universal stress protein [Polaromonas sp.]MDP2452155.1 universal stress protein [Polaromonas sp.]MDP3245980.1 universal stress protein [Polaromonas sp.]MDP3756480.1 universal stress protein [Polaromonas sp.]